MNLFVFGFGYSARCFAAGLADAKIVGAVRSAPTAEAAAEGVEILVFNSARAVPAIAARLKGSDALLVSAPPGEGGDPALEHFAQAIAATRWRAIVYLSTIGVYGDHGGDWVDEASATRASLPRARTRLAAEEAWRALGRSIRAPVHILRLAGIYGPGRNALVKLREGEARRIVKPGQVFNRIHVADVAQAIGLAFGAKGGGGAWNVVDDQPAPPQDVIAFAAGLLGRPPPPEIPFDQAALSTMAQSFYADNKRVANAKLKRELGFKLLYPTYRDGLRALAASGEGRLD